MAVGPVRPTRPLRALPESLVVPDSVLLDAVTAMAAAGPRRDVAEAVCRVLVEVDGVRAVAVTQRSGSDAVIVGSAGYTCDTMAPGARLPLDSGLPIAEATRTGQLVAQGTGPGWIAVPFGRRAATRGALLLSLTTAPTEEPRQLALLDRLARALDAALLRAAEHDRLSHDVSCLLAGLVPATTGDESRDAARQTARDAEVGGDVLLALSEASGARWLVAADVCGSGLGAATGAAAVRTAVHALVPLAQGPARLLELLDTALRAEAPEGGFVTAVVAHVLDGQLRVASAGHPCPVLMTRDGLRELDVEPGPPLALDTAIGPLRLAEWTGAPAADALLVLYTDGLVDRRGPQASDLDIAALLRGAPATTPAELADALIAAAEAAGPAADDTSVLVSRL